MKQGNDCLLYNFTDTMKTEEQIFDCLCDVYNSIGKLNDHLVIDNTSMF